MGRVNHFSLGAPQHYLPLTRRSQHTHAVVRLRPWPGADWSRGLVLSSRRHASYSSGNELEQPILAAPIYGAKKIAEVGDLNKIQRFQRMIAEKGSDVIARSLAA